MTRCGHPSIHRVVWSSRYNRRVVGPRLEAAAAVARREFATALAGAALASPRRAQPRAAWQRINGVLAVIAPLLSANRWGPICQRLVELDFQLSGQAFIFR